MGGWRRIKENLMNVYRYSYTDNQNLLKRQRCLFFLNIRESFIWFIWVTESFCHAPWDMYTFSFVSLLIHRADIMHEPGFVHRWSKSVKKTKNVIFLWVSFLKFNFWECVVNKVLRVASLHKVFWNVVMFSWNVFVLRCLGASPLKKKISSCRLP